MFFSTQVQLDWPQVPQLWRCWKVPTLLHQHVRKVALPGVPQDGEEQRKSPFPSSLQVNDQLPGLVSSAASTLQRRKAQDKVYSLPAQVFRLPSPSRWYPVRGNTGICAENVYTG